MSILKLYLCSICSCFICAVGQRAQIYGPASHASYNRFPAKSYIHPSPPAASYSSLGHSKLVGGRHHTPTHHVHSPPPPKPEPVPPQTTPPEKSCPNGFILSDNQNGCLKASRQIAEVICPEGCEPDHQSLQSHCLEETELTFACPPGFMSEAPSHSEFSHSHADKPKKKVFYNHDEPPDCVRIVQKPPVLRCDDPRMTLVGEECVVRDAVDPELDCGPDMHLSGDICVRKEAIPAQQKCPSGYASENSSVRKLGIGIKQAIRGDKRKKNGGGLTENIIDFDDSIRCVSQRTQEASSSCPRGHRLEKDAYCVLEIIEAVEMRCMEPGFSYDIMTKRCAKEVLSHPDQACKIGYMMEGGECVKTDEENPIPNCRDGFRFDVSEGQCIKVLREPPRMTCESRDFHYDGLRCVKKDKRIPTAKCKRGHLDGDVCVEAIEGHARQACPEGLQLDTILQKCIGTRTKPVEYKCPVGTELINEKECLIIDSVAPMLNCPESYFLIGDSCEKESVTQPSMTCRTPYQLLGGECLAEKASRATLACEPGLELYDGLCSTTDYARGTMNCPPGFSVYKDTCVKQKTMPAESMCPPGFVFDGLQCVGQEEVPLILHCPEGFELSPTDDMCIELPVAVRTEGLNLQKKKIGRKHSSLP